MQFVKLFGIMKAWDNKGEAKAKQPPLPFAGIYEACLLSGIFQLPEMSDATRTMLAKADHPPTPYSWVPASLSWLFTPSPSPTGRPLNVVPVPFPRWGLQFSWMDSLLGVTHHYSCSIPGVLTGNRVSSKQTITIEWLCTGQSSSDLCSQEVPLVSDLKQGQSCACLLELPWLNWWMLQAWTDPLLFFIIILHCSGLPFTQELFPTLPTSLIFLLLL